jgi:hypothetical protein
MEDVCMTIMILSLSDCKETGVELRAKDLVECGPKQEKEKETV